MSNYLDREMYRNLYARYVSGVGRSVDEMLDLAFPIREKYVVDLCGGAGEIALRAKARGASKSIVVDSCPEMADKAELEAHGVELHAMDVETWLAIPKTRLADAMFCRQAVNYWFSEETARDLSNNIKLEGLFIFNTFNKSPSVTPRMQRYVIVDGKKVWYDEYDGSQGYDGKTFVEVVQLVGDMVHHVQCRDGLPMHFTQFRWITRDEFYRLLEPAFSIEVKTDDFTDIYVCRRKV